MYAEMNKEVNARGVNGSVFTGKGGFIYYFPSY